jgi:hypothetical protein
LIAGGREFYFILKQTDLKLRVFGLEELRAAGNGAAGAHAAH